MRIIIFLLTFVFSCSLAAQQTEETKLRVQQIKSGADGTVPTSQGGVVTWTTPAGDTDWDIAGNKISKPSGEIFLGQTTQTQKQLNGLGFISENVYEFDPSNSATGYLVVSAPISTANTNFYFSIELVGYEYGAKGGFHATMEGLFLAGSNSIANLSVRVLGDLPGGVNVTKVNGALSFFLGNGTYSFSPYHSVEVRSMKITNAVISNNFLYGWTNSVIAPSASISFSTPKNQVIYSSATVAGGVVDVKKFYNVTNARLGGTGYQVLVIPVRSTAVVSGIISFSDFGGGEISKVAKVHFSVSTDSPSNNGRYARIDGSIGSNEIRFGQDYSGSNDVVYIIMGDGSETSNGFGAITLDELTVAANDAGLYAGFNIRFERMTDISGIEVVTLANTVVNSGNQQLTLTGSLLGLTGSDATIDLEASTNSGIYSGSGSTPAGTVITSPQAGLSTGYFQFGVNASGPLNDSDNFPLFGFGYNNSITDYGTIGFTIEGGFQLPELRHNQGRVSARGFNFKTVTGYAGINNTGDSMEYGFGTSTPTSTYTFPREMPAANEAGAWVFDSGGNFEGFGSDIELKASRTVDLGRTGTSSSNDTELLISNVPPGVYEIVTNIEYVTTSTSGALWWRFFCDGESAVGSGYTRDGSRTKVAIEDTQFDASTGSTSAQVLDVENGKIRFTTTGTFRFNWGANGTGTTTLKAHSFVMLRRVAKVD